MHFTEFNFHPQLLEGIDASGYINATPVQEQVIPYILQGKDIIASAQTGTGKTAAFLLPIINHLIENNHPDKVSALIVVPTRELAIQIAQHIEGLSYFTNISSIAIYGGSDGQSFIAEKKGLQMGADIVVCTPGRLIAHLNMSYTNLSGIQCLVLDEADRMLDMGFSEDLDKIIKALPEKRQTLLFSATMPEKIRRLARKILQEPVEVNIAISRPPEKIVQKAFVVYEEQKLPLVKHLLKTTPFKSALVFCSRKVNVKQLTRELQRSGFQIGEIHSDLEQKQREDVLQGFGSGRIPILVATDILSRGIDIDTIDLVINYDVPGDGEDYVHRIGRTARAEADGMAFTLISGKEQNKFSQIEELLGKPVEKAAIPEFLGPVPSYNPRTRSGSKGRHRGDGYREGHRGGGQRSDGHRNSGHNRDRLRNDRHKNDASMSSGDKQGNPGGNRIQNEEQGSGGHKAGGARNGRHRSGGNKSGPGGNGPRNEHRNEHRNGGHNNEQKGGHKNDGSSRQLHKQDTQGNETSRNPINDA